MQLSSVLNSNTINQDKFTIEKGLEYSSQSIWLNILDKLKLSDNQNIELRNILENAKFVEIKTNILYFSVKDNFDRETLVRNYFFLIKKTAVSVDRNIKMLSISVDNSIGVDNDNNQLIKANETSFYKNEKLGINTNNIFTKVNSKHTFANYVTGESNQVAYKVSKNIADGNIDYSHSNVFYIHSHVGMGKTHLLQSIVNAISNNSVKRNDGKNSSVLKYRARYLSAERFMHNFVSAVKSNSLFELRSKINELDIFLIDDLQFICGKESTQKEFAYILNSFIESGKKIVIASSIPCHMLELNDEKTKSILRSSNAIYIEPCDYELRLKILNHHNERNDIKFEENILKLIAEKVATSIRELEAGINNLKTYLSVSQKNSTTENICKYIQSYIRSSNKKISQTGIMNAVAKYYRIALTDIVSKKRNRKLVLGRQVIAYLSKELTTNSLKTIGEKIGDRDHSTVLYYINKLEVLMKKNTQIIDDVNNIRSSIT